MFAAAEIPKKLFDKKNKAILGGILRGVEREALRVSPSGALSLNPHPTSLGSALTHPHITTDFSEALLEFITPPTHQVDDLFYQLHLIHTFAASQLQEEYLWPTSMPCALGSDADIPVARYGSSNNGLMKTVYRIGLGHRYGRSMQTVAGVHYNFSLPDAFWAFLSREHNRIESLQTVKNQGYFNLIRNFRRHYWLLIYLFGASPALCGSFVKNKNHQLQALGDQHTLHLPYATSLRMGDLGYQSKVQESLYVCYDKTSTYIKSLCAAITQSHPLYESIGLKDAKGDYRQLNTSILQIENEFYSSIRPKRTARPGETALSALNNRGVEYVEVRCLDINPESPLGFTPEQAYFLDTFLVFCALQPSPLSSVEESALILKNQKDVVNFGRQPGLTLQHAELGTLEAKLWGLNLIEGMRPVAELLDASLETKAYQTSLETEAAKLLNSALTPSAKILATLKEQSCSFAEYALNLAKRHTATLQAEKLDEATHSRMVQMAEESLAEQMALEQHSTQSFDDFLHDYYKQYNYCSQCQNH